MELKFETWLCDGDCVADFNETTTQMMYLGVLTEEDLGCIMDIAAKQRHLVVTRPSMAETED